MIVRPDINNPYFLNNTLSTLKPVPDITGIKSCEQFPLSNFSSRHGSTKSQRQFGIKYYWVETDTFPTSVLLSYGKLDL